MQNHGNGEVMALNFYNTMHRKKEPFTPLEGGKAGVYTCGPTVYNFVHIGNLRTFMFEDLLVRYLRYRGYAVNQVMNLTDVDDKTIKGAIREGVSLDEYTKKYKDAFFSDIETLNISPAQHYPEATAHIEEMVKIVKTLLDKGIAYRTQDGSVYFSISKFPDYGKLSGIKKEELLEGASGRVSADEYSKEEARDFVLWKAWDEEDGDVFWETELGKGRPGWHLECSAMSMKYLGPTFDIHCGGVDNMFPHHENEIAQSEAANERPFVKTWLHSAFLQVNSEKMAKSRGNFYTLRDLLDKGFDPMAIRYALISTHYRQPLNFSEELLAQSAATLKRVREVYNNLKHIKKEGSSPQYTAVIKDAREGFMENLDDDLNISPALGAFFEFVKRTNTMMDQLGAKDAEMGMGFIREINEVIGAFDLSETVLETEILELIKKREEARKQKDFKKADEIRDFLLEKGIVLKDSKEGTKWEKK
jgi:cysteinyl-tRNA synthetase